MSGGHSDEVKGVAHSLLDRFGAPAKILTFRSDPARRGIDIAFFADRPRAGLTTISTIGLCDHDHGPEAGGLGIEIIAAFPSALTEFAKAIGDSALAVMERGWPLRRGAVHGGVLDRYRVSRTLDHLLYVLPSQWEGQPETIVAGGRMIGWLMALPISEAERDYEARYGPTALEDLLAGAGIDMFDLDRPSAATGLGGFALEEPPASS